VAKAKEMATAAAADAKTARVEAEARVSDLEVMLEDKQAEVDRLHAEIKQHEMEKAVKDAQGGTLVECTFADPGPLGIGTNPISTAPMKILGGFTLRVWRWRAQHLKGSLATTFTSTGSAQALRLLTLPT
jgi:hypothetical protein